MSRPILEICIDEPAGVEAAISGGADRVEVCAALALGGLTPSAALVRHACALARPGGIDIHAMVRPRAGDFTWSDAEFALALDETHALIALGVDGLVFGATRDRLLDETVLQRWVDLARGADRRLSLTLHRAIDVVADPVDAVRIAADLGFDRVLTSGGAEKAADGTGTIARMVAAAGERLVVMAGAGVRAENVGALLRATGVREVHASAARVRDEPDMTVKRLGFATPPRRVTDATVVRALRDALTHYQERAE